MRIIAREAVARSFIWQHVLAAVVSFGVAGLVILGRSPPVKITGSWIDGQKMPGGLISVTRQAQWLRSDCTETYITPDLIDSLGYHHVMATVFGGRQTDLPILTREWRIPYTMPLGPASYSATITFFCPPFGSLWPITVEMPTEHFVVMSGPDP